MKVRLPNPLPQVTCPTSTCSNAGERSILEQLPQADSRVRDKKLGDPSPEKLHYHREKNIYQIFQNACTNYTSIQVKTIGYLGSRRRKEKRITQPFLYHKTHQAAKSLQAQSAVSVSLLLNVDSQEPARS